MGCRFVRGNAKLGKCSTRHVECAGIMNVHCHPSAVFLVSSVSDECRFWKGRKRWHVENHIQALSHITVSNAILIRSNSFCRLHDVAIELISNRVSPREEKTSRMERPVSRQGLRLGFYPASDLPCEATEPIGCRFDPLLPSSTLAAEKTGAPQGFEQTIALCYGALRTCVITTCARLQGNHQCH
jgi:hypothetical protein